MHACFSAAWLALNASLTIAFRKTVIGLMKRNNFSVGTIAAANATSLCASLTVRDYYFPKAALAKGLLKTAEYGRYAAVAANAYLPTLIAAYSIGNFIESARSSEAAETNQIALEISLRAQEAAKPRKLIKQRSLTDSRQ